MFSVLLSSLVLSILCNLFSAAYAAPAAPAAPLLVAAASDLYPLRDELTAAVLKATGTGIGFSFGASGVLARQIGNGAPFDLYLSANESLVRDLEGQGKVLPGKVYATGRLGLWSKQGGIKSLDDLKSATVLHVAIPNPAHAPYGAAARDLLNRRGLWQALAPRVVYGENVQQTFQFAESGNAAACITAWSLVRGRGGVLLPADHAPIRQVGAVVAASARRAEAARVLEFLVSPAGRALLSAHGLTPPEAGQTGGRPSRGSNRDATGGRPGGRPRTRRSAPPGAGQAGGQAGMPRSRAPSGDIAASGQ